MFLKWCQLFYLLLPFCLNISVHFSILGTNASNVYEFANLVEVAIVDRDVQLLLLSGNFQCFCLAALSFTLSFFTNSVKFGGVFLDWVR